MGTELQPLQADKPDQLQERPLLKSEEENSGQITPEDLSELEKRFAAYVRKDLYGSMGHGELPLAEKIKIGVAMVTLVPARVVSGILLLVVYYAVCRVCTLMKRPDEPAGEDGQDGYAHLRGWRRKVLVGSGRVLARLMLVVFGFYWIPVTHRSRTEDPSKAQQREEQRPGAIVSNHVSYIDILYHMSSSFPSFVAKRSVGKLPLVGIISKCLGCVFVQRESKSSEFKGVAGMVTERVGEAHQNEEAPMMMLFPEGTTTNGEYLLPFKTGAFLSKAPVHPVILKYPYQRFSPAWDSMSGARHVIFLLCQFVNHMEVTYLPVYCPSQEEKDDAKLYASNVRRLMAMEGDFIMSDIGLPEKRVYHNALNGLVCQG
ncbi:hypothetical protein MLD38_022272 [Melastoma candidum]|uniref:Uncharacterized protein n=1 Tax=Melastoma candidum TaxID=119954 RepID=A0ACB9QI22_9MYRT|nr:hypothetical protein MLD38_022272 [Melastoma candidum]